jgi:exodeoxyribonuclease VIII
MNAPTTEVRHDLTNAEYHASPAISKSGLDLICKAPALYRWRQANPQEQTPAMRLGTLTHAVVLEPDLFELETAVRPEGIDRRTSVGRADWAAFELEAEGREIISSEEWTKLAAIRDAVRSHPAAALALAGSPVIEQSIFWDAGSIACRCRPDAVTERGVIVDLKTTRDASPDGFAKSIAKYRYHVQAAFYSDGYRAAFGEAPRGFVFIAVETDPPYLVAVYVSSEAMTNRGRFDYRADLETFRECQDTDTWPGYSNAPLTIDLPKWA